MEKRHRLAHERPCSTARHSYDLLGSVGREQCAQRTGRTILQDRETEARLSTSKSGSWKHKIVFAQEDSVEFILIYRTKLAYLVN